MMITSSMSPIQLLQTRFHLHWRHKHFNSCCKEEHCKGNRDCAMFFVHILPWTQIHSHQFDTAKLLKINFWRSLRWQFPTIWTRQIFKISLLTSNHDGPLWVTKLMESLTEWPTTLSKLISTTGKYYKKYIKKGTLSNPTSRISYHLHSVYIKHILCISLLLIRDCCQMLWFSDDFKGNRS